MRSLCGMSLESSRRKLVPISRWYAKVGLSLAQSNLADWMICIVQPATVPDHAGPQIANPDPSAEAEIVAEVRYRLAT